MVKILCANTMLIASKLVPKCWYPPFYPKLIFKKKYKQCTIQYLYQQCIVLFCRITKHCITTIGFSSVHIVIYIMKCNAKPYCNCISPMVSWKSAILFWNHTSLCTLHLKHDDRFPWLHVCTRYVSVYFKYTYIYFPFHINYFCT